MAIKQEDPFNNEFDLNNQNLNTVEIRENNKKDNCYIWDKSSISKSYNSFLIHQNSQTKTLCEISFKKSSETALYLPRLIFKKVALNGDIKTTKSEDKIIIDFNSSDTAIPFWDLIGFLYKYKELIDLGEFEKKYKVSSKDKFITEFESKEEQEKVNDLKELIGKSNLDYNQLKSITYENRKKTLKQFYALLTDYDSFREKYKESNNISISGEEIIWHHFLANNDWIVGLNTDIKFVSEIYSEQKLDTENSSGGESPKVDLLGFTSGFTTLVELKHSSTKIFKETKSKGRANTWDFTSDFIEAISQVLGQKFSIERTFANKNFLDEDGNIISKDFIENADPKVVLIIGNKKEEFPIKDRNAINIRKNNTLERFRRNNRNVDIITFDELFERAFFVVYSRKISNNWYFEEEPKSLFY